MRAGKDAFVAAEESVADFLGQVSGYSVVVFGCQIADALVGIEPAIGSEGFGGAGGYARIAI